MTASLAPFLALLVLSAPPTRSAKAEPAKAPAKGEAKPEGTKLEQGQRRFAEGDFEGALKALDEAAQAGGDDATLEKVHLLRAQCFAARQEFMRAEEAFALALEANPEASLDPSRVDPTLVKLLDSVRARLSGTLVLESTPPGAQVSIDGKPAGATPLTQTVPVGRRRLEARWGDGEAQAAQAAKSDVLVKPHRETRAAWVQGPGVQAPPPVCPACPECPKAPEGPQPRPLRAFADVRGGVELPSNPGAYVAGGFEAGGGVEFWWLRAGLWAKLFPSFGLVPRLAFAMPVQEKVTLVVEAGVPVAFLPAGTGIGVSGTGGAEFYPVRWLGFWAALGARHFFTWPGRNDPTAFTVTGGVRLRMP